MPIVVVDTNLLVQAMTGGPGSSPVLQLWKEDKIRLVVCRETLSELASVLERPKFQRYFTTDDARRLLTLLRQRGEWFELHSHVALCRDPNDDVFLNLAISAQADFLVSQDPDLISDETLKTIMAQRHGVKIVRVAELVRAITNS